MGYVVLMATRYPGGGGSRQRVLDSLSPAAQEFWRKNVRRLGRRCLRVAERRSAPERNCLHQHTSRVRFLLNRKLESVEPDSVEHALVVRNDGRIERRQSLAQGHRHFVQFIGRYCPVRESPLDSLACTELLAQQHHGLGPRQSGDGWQS